MVVCAALLACGAALSALTINNDVLRAQPEGTAAPEPECRVNCAPVGGPPLEPCEGRRAARPAGSSAGPAQPAG
jgi:hypothetical protein